MEEFAAYSRSICPRLDDRMIVNRTAGESAEAAEILRGAAPGAILVSPSFSTGWDFPGSQCELILIPKVPWPAKSSAVEAERLQDGEYRMDVAIQALVQQ